MENARQLARVSVDIADADREQREAKAIDDSKKHAAVDDRHKYDSELRCKTQIMGGAWQVRLGDNAANEGQKVILNLKRTPFYAEQGGQGFRRRRGCNSNRDCKDYARRTSHSSAWVRYLT